MRLVIGMRVGGIVGGLLDLDGLFHFLGDVRVHGADHDRREPVSVHVDIGDAVFCGDLDLRCPVSGPVTSVGDQYSDVREGPVDEEP